MTGVKFGQFASLAGLVCTLQAQGVTVPLLDQLIVKVESNYAGFHLEVVTDKARQAAYSEFVANLRQRAVNTEERDCLWLLREYVQWFGDDHLFVQEYPSFSAEEIAEFRANTPEMLTDGIIDGLEQREAELDPIEGLWFTASQEIAVLRTPGIAEKKFFAAVVLESETEDWQAGQVMAEFVSVDARAYRAVLRLDDHTPRRFDAEVSHGLLLHMPPHTWGRRFPLSDHQVDVLDPRIPRGPHLRLLDAETAVLTLPSLSPKHSDALRVICTEHAEAISSRNLLIIDLRGNSGGSSPLARHLAPFYFGDELRPSLRPPGRSHVLSSPDSIAYYDNMKTGFFTPGWLRSLRKRLREHPGELVPMFEGDRGFVEPSPSRRYEGPEHVAILMDERVISAGEAFILEAGRHSKVKTFGAPSGGSIDYQNVSIVGLRHGKHVYGLGYPVIAASEQLPEGGLNKDGIQPDVPIGSEVVDPIGFVREYYR